MEHVLRQGISSSQKQTLGAAIEEEIASTSTSKGIRSKYKHKISQPFVQPYIDPNSGSRPKEVIQPKSSAKDFKSHPVPKTCNDDEIVKHMSNLPSFLQQAQKKNTIQDKALNFGVLDWKRLEKWKYNEHMPALHHKKTTPPSFGSSSYANRPPLGKEDLKNQHSIQSLDPVLLSSGKPISHDLRFSSHVKKEGNSTHRKEEKYVNHMKFQEKEGWLEEFRATLKATSARKGDSNPVKIDLHDRSCSKINVKNCKKGDSRKVLMPEIEASSSERNKNSFSFVSRDNTNNPHGISCETRLNDEVDLTFKYHPTDKQKMVDLPSKYIPNRNCSESPQFTEFADVNETSFPDYFAREGLFADNLSFNDPHSGPMSSGATTHTESPVEPPTNMMRGKSRRHSFSIESSNRTTQDGVSEHSNVKGSQPSPSRRFSFSFARMNRSSSYKESSSISHSSSGYSMSKSGLLMPEASLQKDVFESDKANVSGRRRSSPLRRLLDPLMKHKGGKHTETVQTSSGNTDTEKLETLGDKEQSQDRKSKGSIIQALLQVTLKDGFPFLKLVDDNSKDMLAAVMKKAPSSAKTDIRVSYLFYSVHEIKKKSMNWIIQGSKNKNCSLGYTILGQMKISNNSKLYATDSSVIVRESVLYGVDSGQGDKQNPEIVLGQEIAAVVAKNSIQKFTEDETRLYFAKEVSNNSNDVIVLLPGGVHGMPIKGAHSSLISRWRSGGSCDCGGWDIGCKLRVLTSDLRKSSRTHNASTSCSNIGRVDLYVQGGESKPKPTFSLEPLNNGLYSVKLDSSISLLEAFATCVALVTCREFSDVLDVRDQSESENGAEVIRGTGNNKKTEAKYMSCPPLSPAGRI